MKFDIDAPSLVQALMQFTRQSGLQLMVPTGDATEAPARQWWVHIRQPPLWTNFWRERHSSMSSLIVVQWQFGWQPASRRAGSGDSRGPLRKQRS